MKKKFNAFTMIELMVVISVILILTAFTIYTLGPARAKSRDSRRVTDANLIANAIDQYYTSKLRTYPTPDAPDSTDSKYHAVVIDDDSFLADSSTLSGFLNPIPTDPIGSDEYRYVYVYRGDGKKAAVIVNRLESLVNKCNISETTDPNLPDAVKAYRTGDDLIAGGAPVDDKACYYVAR